MWTDGVTLGGDERAQGRGRAAVGQMDPDLIAAKDNDGWTALHWAAMNGHKDVVALLLDRMDPDLIAAKDNDGWTALHCAAMNGHKDVVALLLDRMDPDLIAATDNDGRTALHWAAQNGHKDVVALLLDRMEGASIAAKDSYGTDGAALRGGERAQGRGRAAGKVGRQTEASGDAGAAETVNDDR